MRTSLVLVVVAAGTAMACQPVGERATDFVVTVRDAQGQAVPDLLIGVRPAFYVGDPQSSLGARPPGVRTDTNGIATFHAQTRAGVPYTDFGPAFDVLPQIALGPGVQTYVTKWTTLLERNAFADRVRVPMTNQETQFTVTLAAVRGRAIVLQLLESGSAKKWDETIISSGDWFLCPCKGPGTTPKLRIAGLPRFESGLMTVGGSHKNLVLQVAPLPTPAQGEAIPETVGDVDLGTVDVGDPNVGTPLTATIAGGTGPKRPDRELSRSGATFIKSDGLAFWTWFTSGSSGRAGPDLQLVDEAPGHVTDTPKLPAGTYYIVPGMWVASDRQWHFLKLLRANALPANHEIPTITIAPGQASASLTINPEPIDAALKVLLNTPVPPPPPPPNP